MNSIKQLVTQYLDYCETQKKLNFKTLKAYAIDLRQFMTYLDTTDGTLSRANLIAYLALLHKTYRTRSVKRKIACLKAFCNYLEYEEIIPQTPFQHISVKFQEPFVLPRTVPLEGIRSILTQAYTDAQEPTRTRYQQQSSIRDIAVLELLFATGMRVSELCSLHPTDVDLKQGDIKIYGKGSKERIVQVVNPDVVNALRLYWDTFLVDINTTGYFFVNRLHHRLSEQSVRLMINRYALECGLPLHVTPHMFRHSFATLLLEEDVDIRYIQQLLGHSSILTTQIYTHVAASKQRRILATHHPRNKIKINY